MKRARLSWRIVSVAGIVAIVVALGLALAAGAVVWTEYGWYASLGRQSVFTTRIVSQLGVWLACTAAAFGVLYATARAAGRLVDKGPRFNKVALWSALVVAGAASISMAQNWMVFRLAVVQAPFGITDPQFGMDVGFFVFTLPALELISTWINGLIVLSMMLAFGILAIPNRDNLSAKLGEMGWEIKALTFRLLGFLMLSVAFNFWINIWRLTYTSRATLVGASYADVHAQLPANWIMVVLSVGLAILLFSTAKSHTWKLAAGAFTAWAVAGIVLVSFWPAVVQRYVVDPNEAALEAPYIKRNIDMTRHAFELTGVADKDYAALPAVPSNSRRDAISALRTARVWTPSAVKEAYAQLQSIRPYYKLSPIETDRYVVSGDLEQVLVAAREIDTSGLPKKARTWVNQHLVYTHGNGLVISSASRTTPQGFPEFLVGDVPPRVASDVASDSPALETTQPRIYFGSGTTDYAIVNTGIDEFDYPAGAKNATYRHDAADGVSVGGLIGRLVWATRLQSLELLFSDYIEPDSQVLMYREVVGRARKIAPWLIYDEKPYAALVDGRIVWILDAYTASDHFPYAQTLSDGTNYLRDSVKVTIDAYTGDVRFYANGEDPIRDAWAKIFPGVISPQGEAPSALAAHFRYPEKFFSAQSEVYRTYHMTDPMVFYNKEDQWQIVGEKSDNPVKPTYLLLDLPGSKHGAGLFLVQPYAPPKRDNMIGIIATDSEPSAYGEQTVYLMPKERVVLGPQQVVARIEQDPTISPQLSLWDQRGSKVIFGDMSVLPVEGSLAYIQPVFLQAENTAISELAAVIVAAGDRISMQPSLSEALSQTLGTASEQGTSGATGAAAGAQIDALLTEVQKAKSAGDWTRYNAKLSELRAALDSVDLSGSATSTP